MFLSNFLKFLASPLFKILLTLLTSLLKHISQFRHFRILTRLLVLALSLNWFLVTCQHQATTSDLPFYDIFAPAKNSSFKVSDDVIARGLWFAPPQSKILATPMTQVVVFPLLSATGSNRFLTNVCSSIGVARGGGGGPGGPGPPQSKYH